MYSEKFPIFKILVSLKILVINHMKQFNFIYKTVLSDGHYYIGQHKTNKLNDKYIGSSKKLKGYIKNNPEIEVHREIICYCESQDELNTMEKFYISKYINDPMCFNQICHAGILENVYDRHGEKHPLWNKHHSEESKKLMRDAHIGIKLGPFTDEHKANLSKSQKGKPGRKHTEEEKTNQSLSMTNRRHMNNGEISVFVQQSEIELYLKKGYIFGRLCKN